MHAVAYAWAQWLDHVQYIVVGADGRVRRTVDIPLPGMTMVHDMSLTQRYAVIYDQPITVDLDMAMSGSSFPFRWNPDYGNRLGFLPREGAASDIVWVDVPLCYTFHPMNAYDLPDGRVVIDQCSHDTTFTDEKAGPFGDSVPTLQRWTVDVARRTVSIDVIDERANEFPRHRGSLTGLPYRYGYCASPDPDSATWPTFKYDLVAGTTQVFDHGAGRAAGEPVFVARRDGVAEDDGWLLTFVHDAAGDTAELVVLDAQDLDRGYVARVPLPQRIPLGFHGNWVSDRSVPPPSV